MADEKKLNQYRITRPDRYRFGSIGWADVKARQGHYYFAKDKAGALEQAREDFIDDTRFDVQLMEGEEPVEPISFAFDLIVAVRFRDGTSSPEETAQLIQILLENHPDVHHATVKVHHGG